MPPLPNFRTRFSIFALRNLCEITAINPDGTSRDANGIPHLPESSKEIRLAKNSASRIPSRPYVERQAVSA